MLSGSYNSKNVSYRDQDAGTGIDMIEVRSFCIGDQDNDGCVIDKRKSSSKKTTVDIDFSLTDSKLCSIVYFPRGTNWKHSFLERRMLSFRAYTESDCVRAEIEMRLMERDRQHGILITGEPQEYLVPLTQFSEYERDWGRVDEVKFLFRKKHIGKSFRIVIEDLCLK